MRKLVAIEWSPYSFIGATGQRSHSKAYSRKIIALYMYDIQSEARRARPRIPYNSTHKILYPKNYFSYTMRTTKRGQPLYNGQISWFYTVSNVSFIQRSYCNYRICNHCTIISFFILSNTLTNEKKKSGVQFITRYCKQL